LSWAYFQGGKCWGKSKEKKGLLDGGRERGGVLLQRAMVSGSSKRQLFARTKGGFAYVREWGEEGGGRRKLNFRI